MSHSQRAAVNQRLYYAKLLLQAQSQSVDQQALPRAVAEQAFGESAVLHLWLAYRRYLTELAVAYQLEAGTFDSAGALAEALQQAGKESAECRELLELERDSSWLSSLLQLWHSLDQPVRAVPGGATAHNPALIATVSADDSRFSPQHLNQLYGALQAMVEAQRTRLEEW